MLGAGKAIKKNAGTYEVVFNNSAYAYAQNLGYALAEFCPDSRISFASTSPEVPTWRLTQGEKFCLVSGHFPVSIPNISIWYNSKQNLLCWTNGDDIKDECRIAITIDEALMMAGAKIENAIERNKHAPMIKKLCQLSYSMLAEWGRGLTTPDGLAPFASLDKDTQRWVASGAWMAEHLLSKINCDEVYLLPQIYFRKHRENNWNSSFVIKPTAIFVCDGRLYIARMSINPSLADCYEAQAMTNIFPMASIIVKAVKQTEFSQNSITTNPSINFSFSHLDESTAF